MSAGRPAISCIITLAVQSHCVSWMIKYNQKWHNDNSLQCKMEKHALHTTEARKIGITYTVIQEKGQLTISFRPADQTQFAIKAAR